MRRISEHVGRHMQLNRTSARDRQTDNIHIKTDRERERTQEYRSTGYRREMAFTRDKDSLMDDSARCFGRSSDTPMIFWWFDRRWHDDEFARGPSSADRTYAADLCDTETTDNSTPSQPTALMDDTVVHRWQGKHLEEHRFREFEVEIDFRISRIRIFHRSGWNRILLTRFKKKKKNYRKSIHWFRDSTSRMDWKLELTTLNLRKSRTGFFGYDDDDDDDIQWWSYTFFT